jgi:hypothetical protein
LFGSLKTYHILNDLNIPKLRDSNAVFHTGISLLGQPNFLQQITLLLVNFLDFAVEHIALQRLDSYSEKCALIKKFLRKPTPSYDVRIQ